MISAITSRRQEPPYLCYGTFAHHGTRHEAHKMQLLLSPCNIFSYYLYLNYCRCISPSVRLFFRLEAHTTPHQRHGVGRCVVPCRLSHCKIWHACTLALLPTLRPFCFPCRKVGMRMNNNRKEGIGTKELMLHRTVKMSPHEFRSEIFSNNWQEASWVQHQQECFRRRRYTTRRH